MRLRFLACLIGLLLGREATASNDLYDPTAPLNRAAKNNNLAAVLELSAIFSVGDKHFAIINGTRVYAGDRVSGIKIKSVKERSVVYSYNGKNYTLNMHPSVIE